MSFFVEELAGITWPKQQWLQLFPDLLEAPMLAQDVRRVDVTGDVDKVNDTTGNSFSNSVVCKHGVSLV